MVAKEMDLQFLYKYGYDFASTVVHPMANDGQEYFLRQTKLGEEAQLIDQKVVVNNSILAYTLLLCQGLNSSDLAWRNILHDFMDDIVSFLNTGSQKYKVTFAKIAQLGPDTEWCREVPEE